MQDSVGQVTANRQAQGPPSLASALGPAQTLGVTPGSHRRCDSPASGRSPDFCNSKIHLGSCAACLLSAPSPLLLSSILFVPSTCSSSLLDPPVAPNSLGAVPIPLPLLPCAAAPCTLDRRRISTAHFNAQFDSHSAHRPLHSNTSSPPTSPSIASRDSLPFTHRHHHRPPREV